MKHINTVQISDTHYVCKALHTPPPHPFRLCVCVRLSLEFCVCAKGSPLYVQVSIHIARSSLLCSSCVVELCELDILHPPPPRPLYTQSNSADHRRIILIYYVLHTAERNSVKSRERDGMAHIIQTSYFFVVVVVVSPSSLALLCV
jgi:hypothetical protein